MLSPLSRKLTFASGITLLLLGILMFVAPAWASENFGWKASPLAVITMGAWYLGAGIEILIAAKIWDWSQVRPLLIFFWVFALGESIVLILNHGALQWGAPMALPYILALGLAATTSIFGIVDWIRLRPQWVAKGMPVPWWVRTASALFVIYVGWLAWVMFNRGGGEGKIWPGPMSVLTARCFGAFYFALVVAQFSLIFMRGLAPAVTYIRPAFFLAVIIEVAAIIFYERWDFEAKPWGLLYHGSYFAAIIGSMIFLTYVWRVKRKQPMVPE